MWVVAASLALIDLRPVLHSAIQSSVDRRAPRGTVDRRTLRRILRDLGTDVSPAASDRLLERSTHLDVGRASSGMLRFFWVDVARMPTPWTAAPPPRQTSLAELFCRGYLSEHDIDTASGRVGDRARLDAERRYRAPAEPSPARAGTRASNRSRPEPARAVPVRPEPARVVQVRPKQPTSVEPACARPPPPTCCVCMEHGCTHVYAPCFHLCVCETCALRTRLQCPLCRTVATGVHRVYM